MTIARSAAFNFMGAAVPAAVSLLTIPYIVHRLGPAEFGLLTLVTAVIGYFALLDINLSASATRFVSFFNASSDSRGVDEAVTFGLVAYCIVGCTGGVLIFVLADTLASALLASSANDTNTAGDALRIAALGFLFGQVQSYLQSLLGAFLRFDLSGRIEAAFGTAVPLATVWTLWIGFGLTEIILVRVVFSLLQCLLLIAVLRRLRPSFALRWPSAKRRSEMLSFSGFAFLNRVASLSYTHGDKLIIGAISGASALTYFAIPSTLTSRVMAMIHRLSAVMFPHASGMAASGRDAELKEAYLWMSRYSFFVNGVIGTSLAFLSEPLLAVWIGPDFAKAGWVVMALIALCLWTDSLTNLPSLLTDGLGSPAVTGSFALARATIGLGLVAIGVSIAGIVGAAAAHLIASVVFSIAFLIYAHGRTVPVHLMEVVRSAHAPACLALTPVVATAWGAASLVGSGWFPMTVAIAAIGSVAAVFGWALVVTPGHRETLSRRFSAAQQ